MTQCYLVVGVDPASTHLALVSAVVPPGATGEPKRWEGWWPRAYDLATKSGPDVLSLARRVLTRYIGNLIVDTKGRAVNKWCVIEQPVIMGHGNVMSSIVQAYMNGVIQEVFYDSGFAVAVIPPAQWKKAIAPEGGGSAGKTAVQMRVRQLLTADQVAALKKDENLFDAAAISFFAATLAAANEPQ